MSSKQRNGESPEDNDVPHVRAVEPDSLTPEEDAARRVLNEAISLASGRTGPQVMRGFDDLIARYEASESADIRDTVAMAIAWKAELEMNDDRYQSAVEIYDELLARFSDATEPPVRLRVSAALCRQGYCLETLARTADARAAYLKVLDRFRPSEGIEIEAQIVYAQDRYDALRKRRPWTRSRGR